MLTVCAWCDSVKIGQNWVYDPFRKSVAEKDGVASHGICDECLAIQKLGLKRAEELQAMDDDIVRGGQGRDSEDARSSATMLGVSILGAIFVIVVALFFVFVLGGCCGAYKAYGGAVGVGAALDQLPK